MSQENLGLTLAIADAFNRRDWTAVLALTDEEIRVEARPDEEIQVETRPHEEIRVESRRVSTERTYRVYHGHEGLRRWWDTFLGSFPDYTIEVMELHDLGDMTLVRMRGQWHDGSTLLVDLFWQTLRWRHGKCVWWRAYATEEEARAGLRE
jgi:hypothetical protein